MSMILIVTLIHKRSDDLTSFLDISFLRYITYNKMETNLNGMVNVMIRVCGKIIYV